MRLVERMKELDSGMVARVGTKRSNTVRMTGAVCTANFLLGTGKLLLGIFSASFFTVVNALYTYGMVAAKLCALKGIAVPVKKQYACYRGAAGILIAASLFYALYASRLLLHPKNTKYHPYLAMGIAAVTFTEIGLNLWGVLAERRKKSLTFHALKTINLASSLIGLVLTQAAILSFASELTDAELSLANGVLGLCMGGCAALLGGFMLWRAAKLESKEENA